MRFSLEEQEKRLLERKNKNARQKNKALLEEKNIKDAERKIKTQKKIIRGGLIEKAGLASLNNNTLLGALLEIEAKSKDPANIKKWKNMGDAAFKKDQEVKRKKSPEKLPTTLDGCLFVTFPSEPEIDVKDKLKDLGFKWCKIRKEWRGPGNLAEIRETFPEATVQENDEH